MEFEALLLGIEPLTALAVGAGAAILVPVVDALGSAMGQNKLSDTVSESAKELTKNGLVWGFEVWENAQASFAEAEESFRDLVADAKTEHMVKKAKADHVRPHEVEIVSDNT